MKSPNASKSSPVISVLIVEDVDEMRHLIEHVVSEIPGVKVSGMVKNGFEARLEVTRRCPDLVLLDEVLPGESSHDLIQEFLSLKIKIVLMTGMEDPSHPLPPQVCSRMIKPGWKSLEEDRNRIKKLIFDGMGRTEA